MLDAFHLPGIPRPPTAAQLHGRLELTVAELTPELLVEQIEALEAARLRYLAARPVLEIVELIDQVAARLLDPADELRVLAEEALPAVTGYSRAVIRHGLDRMAADWRAPALLRLLREELADPNTLDAFRPRTHAPGRRRAYGPRLVAHVFSGNVPGVAVTSLIRALLVKAASIAKTASGEPVLPVLFARGLHEMDPGLGECLAISHWPGGAEALERTMLSRAEVVAAYGGATAIEAIRSLTPPAVRLLEYGARVSFGVVTREALTASGSAALAGLVARDVAAFDQQGCVSPHLIFVEEGGELTPAEWAERLAAALAAVEAELPRGTLEAGESFAIHRARAEAEFAGIGDGRTVVHASEGGTEWTVILEPDPGFTASCLNRFVRVKPIASADEVPSLLRGVEHLLQTVGMAGPPDRIGPIASELGRLGVSRVAPFGSMAWPPSTWHHDGRSPLTDLLHWCDVED